MVYNRYSSSNPKKPSKGPFARRFVCRPAHENLPKSILEWMADNPEPKDDALQLTSFSYDPAHLPAWHMQQALRDRLPAEMLPYVVATQEAGAAVLTSLERLAKLQESLEEDEQKWKPEARDGKHAMPRPIPPLPLACRSAIADVDDDEVASISTGATAGSASSSSVNSFCSDMTSRTTIPSRSSSTFALMEKKPVFSFTQSDDSNVSSISTASLRNNDSSFSKLKSTPLTFLTIPMESTPARARYSAERFHLRTEALARLSHMVEKLDSVFEKHSRGHDQKTPLMEESVYDDFDQWYRGKKAVVRALEDRVRTLEVEGVVLNADTGIVD